MTLATVLGFLLVIAALPARAVGVGSEMPLPNAAFSSWAIQSQESPPSQPPAQSPNARAAQSAPASSEQPPATTAPVTPPQSRWHRKKNVPANCSDSPTPLKPTPNADSRPADAAPNAGSNPAANSAANSSVTSPDPKASALKPCPPPKKVVRNGGSTEPIVELSGGTADQKAFQQSSTAELTSATEENLKKMTVRTLDAGQKEMVSQIKLFLDQSKAAVAAGDLERGRNLAMKARLLSDELVKPE